MLSPKRKGKITGSSAGALLGLSPFITAADAFKNMVRKHAGLKEDITEFQRAIFDKGHFYEKMAMTDYKFHYPAYITDPGFMQYNSWLGATPDSLIWELDKPVSVLEIKCPHKLLDKEDPEFQPIHEQPHYYAQVQIEMLCASVDTCHFYQWSPKGSQLEIVSRSDEWLNTNIPRLKSIHDAYLEAIKPENIDFYLTPDIIEIDSPFAGTLLDEYDELVMDIEMANNRLKEIKGQLGLLGGGKKAIINGRKVTPLKNGWRIT